MSVFTLVVQIRLTILQTVYLVLKISNLVHFIASFDNVLNLYLIQVDKF